LRLGARGGNVRDVFVAGGGAPVAPRVLLVDDVYTTGSTAHAAAAALKRGGAVQVDVVTFARALR
jgi:predicted amidophosphoribosyltransferase